MIDSKALAQNVNLILAEAEKTDTKIIAMLKGNGYGLGIEKAASFLYEHKIRMFSAALSEEAIKIREAAGDDCEVLLLSPTCVISEAEEALKHNITLAVGSESSFFTVSSASENTGIKARVHIAIDTGFGRFGFLPDEAKKIKALTKQYPDVEICGVFSHLSDSFGKRENSYMQLERFNLVIKALENLGVNTGIRHIANSCAFLRFSDMRLDAARIGSAFLGRLPISTALDLKKIAYLESRVCDVKILPKGANIGYANTCTLKRNTKIAVVPVGYMDGFGVAKKEDAFRFSDKLRYVYAAVTAFFKDNGIYVTVDGKKCRVLGRVSMFNIICDITDTSADVGSVVRLECNPILINPEIEREYI